MCWINLLLTGRASHGLHGKTTWVLPWWKQETFLLVSHIIWWKELLICIYLAKIHIMITTHFFKNSNCCTSSIQISCLKPRPLLVKLRPFDNFAQIWQKQTLQISIKETIIYLGANVGVFTEYNSLPCTVYYFKKI